MDPNNATNPGNRIDALQKSGRIAPADATDLREAYASDPASKAAPTRPPKQSFPDFAHVFLSGAIDEATLRQRSRQRGVQMGAMFAVLFAIGMVLTTGWRMSWWKAIAIWLPAGAVAGVLFAWIMHRTLLQPAVERLARLRREAGILQPIGLVDAGQCPTCRAEEFDVWTWRTPAVLHWIVNPAIAFNEVVLGQRLPANTKVCKQCHTFAVDCPHCHRAIDGMQWAGRRAFCHWGDLRCPHCDGALPTLSNALAYVVWAPFKLVAKLLPHGGAA